MNNSYTVLEIGSGSFKLHKEGSFSARFQSSLGKDLKGNKLDSESVQIALNSVEKQILPFLKEHEIKPEDLLVFATAAVRRAVNDPAGTGERFINKLKDYGIKEVKVFSEEEECNFAAWAVIEEIKDKHKKFLILDTGGASHQLMEIKQNSILLKRSFPIGSHTDLTTTQLPNYSQYGFSKQLPLVLLGTSAVILGGIPNLNRNTLKEVLDILSPMSIDDRRKFLSIMIPDETIHPLFVDFRLAILPNAFRIVLSCADILQMNEFIFSSQQAINYISKYGFKNP